MLNDKEKLQLAEVVDMVVSQRIKELGDDLAKTVVTIIDCVMEDLVKIMDAQNGRAIERLAQIRAHRDEVREAFAACFRVIASEEGPDEALCLAAWLVSIAEPFATQTFKQVLEDAKKS